MASRTEQHITLIEDYIEDCKYAAFSSNKITVDRDKLLNMLEDLRDNLPEEMMRCQQIVDEQQRILDEARDKASKLIEETTERTNRLVSEQEIMKKAYDRANEIVAMASNRAQKIEQEASRDAENYRRASIQYMEKMLSEMDQCTRETLRKSKEAYDQYNQVLSGFASTLYNNQIELQSAKKQF